MEGFNQLSAEAQALLQQSVKCAWETLSQQGRLTPFAVAQVDGEFLRLELSELNRFRQEGSTPVLRSLLRLGIVKLSNNEVDALLVDIIKLDGTSVSFAQPMHRTATSNRLTPFGEIICLSDRPTDNDDSIFGNGSVVKNLTTKAQSSEFISDTLGLIPQAAAKIAVRASRFSVGIGFDDLSECMRSAQIKADDVSKVVRTLQWLVHACPENSYFFNYVCQLIKSAGTPLDNLVICCSEKGGGLSSWRGRAVWSIVEQQFSVQPVLDRDKTIEGLTPLLTEAAPAGEGLLGRHLLFLPFYEETDGWALHEWLVGVMGELGAFVGHGLLSLWVKLNLQGKTSLDPSNKEIFSTNVAINDRWLSIQEELYQLCVQGFRLGTALEVEHILFESYASRSRSNYNELLRRRLSETIEFALFSLRKSRGRSTIQDRLLTSDRVVETVKARIEEIRSDLMQVAARPRAIDEDIAA